MPMACSLRAQNRQDQLRRLLILGTRAALFVSLLIGGVLFLRGSSFIGFWIGHKLSGRKLRMRFLSALAQVGDRVGDNIPFGLGKHEPFALW
jgi:O-antigen/teichoic acid export membrane protein